MPLPGDETLPDTEDIPLLGSGFNFLNAPSAGMYGKCLTCYAQSLQCWKKL